MRLTILSLFSIILLNICQGQDISELEKRNGFKTIKLQMIADSINGVKLKKEFKEKAFKRKQTCSPEFFRSFSRI